VILDIGPYVGDYDIYTPETFKKAAKEVTWRSIVVTSLW